ncbi:MAG: class I SAM-dependent methyltransferase [Acidobacteriota bacterium]|nr:class I SAM-dependent methyltransferase [Acidobacteriota bacterium]MDH3523702.1 class I SAM-dependent methyltransferase [Acidobacteriota bacterium]
MADAAGGEPGPGIEAFVAGRARSPEDWRWLWEGNREFPIRSHRGAWGRLVVLCKRLLRPLVRVPQADLWERQRQFNLVLVETMSRLAELDGSVAARLGELHRDLLQVRGDLVRDVRQHARRLAHLEEFKREGLDEITRHSDALFARVDQKFDRYRRESRQLWDQLGSLLAVAGTEAGPAAAMASAREEMDYVDLEDRFRGLESDIAERLAVYRPYLEGRGEVLDLGCGRGEALAVLAAQGIVASGVDSSSEMVRACVEKGLSAVAGDLFETLAAAPEGTLGGVVSFHVIEHLPAPSLARLVRLAWRALAPGGALILETPNPLSVVVAARNFWIDPTHRRPVHPATLRLLYEQAGFERIERLDLRRFGAEERLPEIATAGLPEAQQRLAHEVNGLRDRLDELLFGYQDFALVGFKAR